MNRPNFSSVVLTGIFCARFGVGNAFAAAVLRQWTKMQ